jgi:hypothetical protein
VNNKPLISALMALCMALPAYGTQERSCDEEQQQAAAWIEWATERRAACRAVALSRDQEAACLQQARAHLTQAERDHANVYSLEIRALDPGHPVVKGLLSKLRDNVQAAEAVIGSEADPQQIAAIRKQNCMNRR